MIESCVVLFAILQQARKTAQSKIRVLKGCQYDIREDKAALQECDRACSHANVAGVIHARMKALSSAALCGPLLWMGGGAPPAGAAVETARCALMAQAMCSTWVSSSLTTSSSSGVVAGMNATFLRPLGLNARAAAAGLYPSTASPPAGLGAVAGRAGRSCGRKATVSRMHTGLHLNHEVS
jgi:hypothetical protein